MINDSCIIWFEIFDKYFRYSPSYPWIHIGPPMLGGMKVTSGFLVIRGTYLYSKKQSFNWIQSYNYHVMMWQLLPFALRGILGDHVCDTLLDLCIRSLQNVDQLEAPQKAKGRYHYHIMWVWNLLPVHILWCYCAPVGPHCPWDQLARTAIFARHDTVRKDEWVHERIRS
jgi:hypothetical protein